MPGSASGETLEQTLERADALLYQAKNEGRNDYRFFTPDMNSRAYARLKLENALRRALDRNELDRKSVV